MTGRLGLLLPAKCLVSMGRIQQCQETWKAHKKEDSLKVLNHRVFFFHLSKRRFVFLDNLSLSLLRNLLSRIYLRNFFLDINGYKALFKEMPFWVMQSYHVRRLRLCLTWAKEMSFPKSSQANQLDKRSILQKNVDILEGFNIQTSC